MPKRNNAPLSFVLFIPVSPSLEAASGGAITWNDMKEAKQKVANVYQLVKTEMKFQRIKIIVFHVTGDQKSQVFTETSTWR